MSEPVTTTDSTGLHLLSQCGADAQSHPVDIVDGVARFRKDPFIRLLANQIDLNLLWHKVGAAPESREMQLGVRKFYRQMGYSLWGYLEVFGEELDREEEEEAAVVAAAAAGAAAAAAAEKSRRLLRLSPLVRLLLLLDGQGE